MFKMWEVGGQTGTSGRDLALWLFELARVLVRLDDLARFIVNANQGVVSAAAMLSPRIELPALWAARLILRKEPS
jgi:hypothetical protein